MSEQKTVKGSGSLEFDGLLAEFHAIVWASAEDGDCDYDMAGIDTAKKLQSMYRDKEFGDAYQGAREDLASWKRRALEAEAKVREQDGIIDRLGDALNDENGPCRFGEPSHPN